MSGYNYFPYEIVSNRHEAEDTSLIRLRPQSAKKYLFIPGQHCYLKIPDSEIAKPFSIASAPEEHYLEFCIKTYGPFSQSLTMLEPGDTVLASEPTGSFVWDKSIKNASFLIGGIGISPIVSMLSHIEKTNQHPELTLFYGNRTPETKAYAKKLSHLEKSIPLRVIDIYSHLDPKNPWSGYRGFITKKIIQKETADLSHIIFFLVGPRIFLEKMSTLLLSLHITKKNIRTEKIS